MAQTCRDGGTADALDSGSSTCMGVGVQIPFSAVNLKWFSNTYIGRSPPKVF